MIVFAIVFALSASLAIASLEAKAAQYFLHTFIQSLAESTVSREKLELIRCQKILDKKGVLFMKYWHKIWPYGLFLINLIDIILIIYEGQIFKHITSIPIHLMGIFFGLGEITTRSSK